MCGISGFIGNRKYLPTQSRIMECLDLMKLRRGPDGADHITVNKENYSFAFLHARLAIIDPHERSNQPMEDSEGIISFVGEIYNYIELRSTCEKQGVKFKTKSDTEVLLKVLNIYGNSGISMLDGDWAFSYYNKKSDKILVSKDRFSVKPLFYVDDNKGFYFSTNVPHLFKLMGRNTPLNYGRIHNYLSFGFRGTELHPNTLFESVTKFPSGAFLEFNRGRKAKETYYWDKNININSSINYEDAVDLVKETFTDSIKLRLRSDFKIGCLLSAGIDSSAIGGISKKIFNNDLNYVSYKPSNKNYDESDLIEYNIKSLEANHKYITIENGNNIQELQDLILDAALPLNAPSDFLFHKLCKELKNQNCRVLLTGSAGDDLFAGNFVDHLNYLVSIYNTPDFPQAYDDWEKNIKPLIRSPELKDFSKYLDKVKKDSNSSWTEKELVNEYINFDTSSVKTNYMPTYSSDIFRNQLCKNMFDETVPANLSSHDHIAMFHSLEGRFPFLSHKLYEVVNSLPSKFLMKKAVTKSVLRDAVKGVLPNEILNSKNKIGFYMDFKDIFKSEMSYLTDVMFQNNEFNKLIKVDKLKKVLDKKETNTAEQKLVFSLVSLSVLFQEYD